MCTPPSDVADPDPLASSLLPINGQILTATRSPRSSQPPSIPPRNPLRPRQTSVPSDDNDSPALPPRSPLRMQIVHTQSLPLLGTGRAITVHANDNLNVDEKSLRKSLPESPTMSPLSSVDTIDDGDSSTESSSILNNPAPSPPTTSKRNHALLELLSSERAYASDLVIIRTFYIPLALGQSSPFNPNASSLSSSSSSSSSSRAISIASNSSGSSSSGPPMAKEDVKIIFNNVTDLALLSDYFAERLEEALGSVVESGAGQDFVGALFLEMIPLLEPPYQKYITRHPTALEHLNGLPKTPSLNAYLDQSRTLASSLTHAWDLPSLLIKPVQRLLKYSLLLAAVIEGTPDDHPDKENLIKAKTSMEEVARGVNEGRRRREVIKEVLTGGKNTPDSASAASNGTASVLKPKKGLTVGVSASVKLVKGMKHAVKSREGADGNEEKNQVEKMEAELKRCEAFIRKFAKEAVDWTHKMKHVMTSLYAWADVFGQVIGISSDSVSEAFDAFKMVLRAQIIPVCEDLEKVVQERLLPQLSLLVDSMNDPFRLLEAMHTLEPLHYGLLNLDVSKSRPPPTLLEASQSYVALRGQLFAELPQYLKLLHNGITASIVQLSAWQTTFYKDAHVHWGELWEALRVEEDSCISCAPETMQIWWDRFSVLEEALGELGILRRPKVPLPSPSVGTVKTPTGSINGTRPAAEVVLTPGSASSANFTPQLAGTSQPVQYVQYTQYPRNFQLQSPPRPQQKQQVNGETRSPPHATHVRKRSGSVPARVNAMMHAFEPERPASPRITHTVNRDAHDGKRKKQGRSSDVTVPPMELSQTYPRQSNNNPSPPYSAQYHPHSRPPVLPHSNTQPIPCGSVPTRRPTHTRARSHSRATIEEFRYLGAIIGDTSTTRPPPYVVATGLLEQEVPGFARRGSSRRGSVPSGNMADLRISRGSRSSQNVTMPSNADEAYVSEVPTLESDSRGERDREAREERPKPQRRGSVKKKLTDTLENVAKRSPSIHSLKRFSGPPRLGSPAPTQQTSSQPQGNGRSHSRSRSRPATPHNQPHQTYPVSPPLVTSHSSNSTHSQGPYSTPVLLYACRAIIPFRLDRDIIYRDVGFHTLEVGMKLGIVEEHGHPCMHPDLPLHIDDGEDCLLLAVDMHGSPGWAFASFLVPLD